VLRVTLVVTIALALLHAKSRSLWGDRFGVVGLSRERFPERMKAAISHGPRYGLLSR